MAVRHSTDREELTVGTICMDEKKIRTKTLRNILGTKIKN